MKALKADPEDEVAMVYSLSKTKSLESTTWYLTRFLFVCSMPFLEASALAFGFLVAASYARNLDVEVFKRLRAIPDSSKDIAAIQCYVNSLPSSVRRHVAILMYDPIGYKMMTLGAFHLVYSCFAAYLLIRNLFAAPALIIQWFVITLMYIGW